MVSFEELAVNVVKKACREYFVHKNTNFILEHCGYNDVPLIGVDKPCWECDYLMVGEYQQVNMLSEDLCMITEKLHVKSAEAEEKEEKYYTGTFLCQYNDNNIQFVNVHISENSGVGLIRTRDSFSNEYYKRTLQYMYDVVFEYDSLNNSFSYDPVKYKRLFQTDAHFVSMDQWFWNLCTECVNEEDTELLDIFRSNDIGKRIRNDECVVEDDIRIKNRERGYIWVKMVVVFIPNNARSSIEKIFVMFKDVDDEKRKQLDFKYKARIDSVTELYNRDYAKEKIDDYLNRESSPSGTYVIFDIDNFKEINDTFGHIAGNEILKKVGKRIYDNIGADDVVGRIGSDEFCVFMRNCDVFANVENRINNIIRKASFVYNEEGVERKISCSAGAAILSDKCKSLSEMCDVAERNLSSVLRGENNCFKIS
jgi:diguanylate cyclase (GGDEF)-like protein